MLVRLVASACALLVVTLSLWSARATPVHRALPARQGVSLSTALHTSVQPSRTQPSPAPEASDAPHRSQPRDQTAASRTLTAEHFFQSYVVRRWRQCGPALSTEEIEIVRHGQRLHLLAGGHLRVLTANTDLLSSESTAPAWIGNDITGDCQPNLTVCQSHGGSNSPDTLHVFEIGARFRLITKVSVYDWSFNHMDADRVPELVVVDNYGYWPAKNVIRPTVVLRFRDGAYHPAPELMRRPLSEFADYQVVAQRILRQTDSDTLTRGPPFALCAYTVDLIYAGHGDFARRFVDLAWPLRAPGKAAFLDELSRHLAHQPYWTTVKTLSSW